MLSNSEKKSELEKRYEQQIKDAPNSGIFLIFAELLIKKGKVDKAIGVLVNGLKHNKENVTARFLLGKIYYERWMVDLAKKELEKVISLAPDNLAALKILVEIYKSENDEFKAKEILMKAQKYYPNNVEIERRLNSMETNTQVKLDFNINEKRSNNHNSGSPKSNSLKNAEISSDTSSEYVVSEILADLYLQQGHYIEAVKVYEALLNKEPSDFRLKEKLDKCKSLFLNQKVNRGFDQKK